MKVTAPTVKMEGLPAPLNQMTVVQLRKALAARGLVEKVLTDREKRLTPATTCNAQCVHRELISMHSLDCSLDVIHTTRTVASAMATSASGL